MNVNTVANILLIAAAVVWILAKQVKAAPIKTRLLVLAPLLMGYFGIKDTPVSTWKSGADLAFILVGALFSIGLGLWRGGTIRVWRESDGGWWRAGTKSTLYLWGALLVVRAVLAGVADATGHKPADGLGPILFSLALSFAAQNAVIATCMSGAPVPGFGNVPGSAPLSGSGPVDLGQYNGGQYNGWQYNGGQYDQYDEQGGHAQTPGYQRQTAYSASADFSQRADSRHERIDQRRVDRRDRRAQRRGRA